MLTDIQTVFWKEWNEFLHARSSMKGTLMTMFFPVLVFGVFFPLQAGRDWVESAVPLMSFAWIPLLFVSAMTADSFAGERERHTFETLLASRLSDNAIFFGKLSAAISYGLFMTALIAGTGIVSVNIAEFDGSFLFYPFKAFLFGSFICILASTLIAGIGILISMKAQTVRQAHQTLSFAIVIIALSPTLLFRFLPRSFRQWLIAQLERVEPSQALTAIIIFLCVLTLAIITYAAKKCRRTSLNFE